MRYSEVPTANSMWDATAASSVSILTISYPTTTGRWSTSCHSSCRNSRATSNCAVASTIRSLPTGKWNCPTRTTASPSALPRLSLLPTRMCSTNTYSPASTRTGADRQPIPRPVMPVCRQATMSLWYARLAMTTAQPMPACSSPCVRPGIAPPWPTSSMYCSSWLPSPIWCIATRSR